MEPIVREERRTVAFCDGPSCRVEQTVNTDRPTPIVPGGWWVAEIVAENGEAYLRRAIFHDIACLKTWAEAQGG